GPKRSVWIPAICLATIWQPRIATVGHEARRSITVHGEEPAMRLKRAAGYLLASTAVATGLVLGISSPASAHETARNINWGGVITYGWVDVDSSHRTITICDKRADNVGVYAEYNSYNGRYYEYGDVSDTNGSQAGCGQESPPYGYYIVAYN